MGEVSVGVGQKRGGTVKDVSIYNVICKVSPVDCNNIIKSLRKDLSDAMPKEIIRFISGEANCEIYNPCGDYLRECYQKKKLKYEVIVGPVVSGCRENGKLRNTLLDLAEEGILKLYLSKVRRELHMRIVGNMILRGEIPHPPIYKEIQEYVLDTRKYRGKEKQRVTFAIESRVQEFEAMKVFSECVPPTKVGGVLLLGNSEISDICKKARDLGLSFDLLTQKKILEFRDML